MGKAISRLGMKSFLQIENDKRKSEFKKTVIDEEFLVNFNELLKEFKLEKQEFNDQHPWIFVTGLPRSGTTLLMQLMASSFNVCFVNNFIARFWDAPIVGARLSKILSLQSNISDSSSFRSDYGKTTLINEPHEWSYFWIHHLKYDRSLNYNRKEISDSIIWKEITNKLNGITSTFNRPFLCKGLHPIKFIDKIIQSNPNVFVVNIERDFKENCQSVLEARKAYFEDPNEWWSIIPDNYKDIHNLPYIKQIPEQLKALKLEMQNDIAKYCSGKSMKINYEDLIDAPRDVLRRISENIELSIRFNLEYIPEKIPERFEKKVRNEFDREMMDYVNQTIIERIVI